MITIVNYSCQESKYVQGKQLYDFNCSSCHMLDGSGVAKLYPSLNPLDTSRVQLSDMPCIIRNGLSSEGSVLHMQGIKSLKDIEINNIINYILNDLNNLDVEYQIDDTRRILQNCDKE